MLATILYTGTTHNTNGSNASARSDDGVLNLKLPAPHPAAEDLFGAAWSACYMAALSHVAQSRKVKLGGDLAVDATIELCKDGSEFFLRANLKVTVPGVDRDQAQELVDAAHLVCPYSKAVHGNIEVTTTVA